MAVDCSLTIRAAVPQSRGTGIHHLRHTGWRWGSGWSQLYSGKSGSYGPSNSYYLGNTISGFSNNVFCWPLPTVYTYYYFNKMWGHPNGTATRDQSSDSIDECLPFHVDIESAYGHFPG